jgi:hypothetical protein
MAEAPRYRPQSGHISNVRPDVLDGTAVHMWNALAARGAEIADIGAAKWGEEQGQRDQSEAGTSGLMRANVPFGKFAEAYDRGAKQQFAIQKDMQIDRGLTEIERSQIESPDPAAFRREYDGLKKQVLEGLPLDMQAQVEAEMQKRANRVSVTVERQAFARQQDERAASYVADREDAFNRMIASIRSGDQADAERWMAAVHGLDAAARQQGFATAKGVAEQQRKDGFDVMEAHLSNEYGAVQGLDAKKKWLDALPSRKLEIALPPERVRAIQSRLTAEIRELERDQRERLVLERAEVADLIRADISSRAETGIGIRGLDDRRVAAALGPARFQNYVASREAANAAFATVAGLKTAPMAEGTRAVEALRPQGGDPDFDTKQAAYAQVQHRWNQMLLARSKDPVQYTVTMSENVREAFARSHQEGMRASLAMQEQMGIPEFQRRVLTETQADTFAAQIKQAQSPDQAEATFRQMEQEFGPHYEAAVRDMVKHSKFDPQLNFAASLVGRPEFNVVFGASGQKLDALREAAALPDGEFTSLKRGIEDRMREFNRAVAAGSPSGLRSTQIEQVNESILKTALVYVSQGVSPSEATKRATGIVLDQYEVIRNRNSDARYYVPRQSEGALIDPGRIERAASELAQPDRIRAFGPLVPESMKRFLTETFREDQLIASAASRGYWVTNRDGSGMFFMLDFGPSGSAPLLSRDGRRYEFKFADIMRSPDIGRPQEPASPAMP